MHTVESRGRWQDLALARQRLVACDRACAAAADAFAMKVVAAGGLEPRYDYAPDWGKNKKTPRVYSRRTAVTLLLVGRERGASISLLLF